MTRTVKRSVNVTNEQCHLVERKRGLGFFGSAFAQVYDHLMSGIPYNTWVDYLEDAASQQGCRLRRILDLACGTGSFAILALDRGLEVIGVDSSPWMLAHFKAKLAKHPQRHYCQDVQAALADFAIEGQVDAAVCFFDSLNYIIDHADFKSALTRISHSLRRGGLLLFDLNSENVYRQNLFQQAGIVEKASGIQLTYSWRGEYCAEHSLYSLDLSFRTPVDSESKFRECHLQRFYSREVIQAWLKGAGFEKVRCLRAFSFEEACASDERLTFLAVKA